MHCQNAVVNALKALAGVSIVNVDLNTGKVTVECESNVSSRKLAKAIEDVGYTVV